MHSAKAEASRAARAAGWASSSSPGDSKWVGTSGGQRDLLRAAYAWSCHCPGLSMAPCCAGEEILAPQALYLQAPPGPSTPLSVVTTMPFFTLFPVPLMPSLSGHLSPGQSCSDLTTQLRSHHLQEAPTPSRWIGCCPYLTTTPHYLKCLVQRSQPGHKSWLCC